jgi:CRISPR system Cascade subunit CasE
MSNSDLHMIQALLDSRRLVELGRMLHLPIHQVDLNYVIHCTLGELFGEHSPQPWCCEDRGFDRGKKVRVLAYSDSDATKLQEIASEYASPPVYAACVWQSLASKPMPALFTKGRRYRFNLHACPVQRMSKAGQHWQEGSEVDVFVARAWRVGPEIDLQRSEVYQQWLTDYFERQTGAVLEDVKITNFKLERFYRRSKNSKRKGHVFKKPAVTFEGQLEVTDERAFYRLLRKGIGRHKAFGFGMLKLKPV